MWRVVLLSIAISASVLIAARTFPLDVRYWLPLVYLVLAYWVPSILVPSQQGHWFEAWLQRNDPRWRQPFTRLPHPGRHILELSYLTCYAVVPLALLFVWIRGSAEDIERFWVSVLLSGFACYITIPWLVSRPPRLIDAPAAPASPIASINLFVLGHASHRMNTFPSGHVAVATAVACAVFPVSYLAGAIAALTAASIAVGAVVGGYHFAIDVILGAAVGIAVAAASSYW
jgi:membrane-associated phospholipid phosphatase